MNVGKWPDTATITSHIVFQNLEPCSHTHLHGNELLERSISAEVNLSFPIVPLANVQGIVVADAPRLFLLYHKQVSKNQAAHYLVSTVESLSVF